LGAPDEIDALSRFDDRDFVVGQPIELVDQLVDLAIRRVNLALENCAFVADCRPSQP